MRFNRIKLLEQLECVTPGISDRDLSEQAACIAFLDGRAYSYNDEVSCSVACDLEITGAVKAKPLLAIMRKLPEDDIEIEQGDGELVIKGKRRQMGVRMESEVLMPIASLERPKRMKELNPEFCDAIGVVQQCASDNEAFFNVTCVHITPEWVEACDNYQMSRYRVDTGFKGSFLVRRNAVRFVRDLGMTKFGETDSWVHFSNANGLLMSCRRYLDDYPDLAPMTVVEGDRVMLPKGLADAADKASVFSSDNLEHDEISVRLSSDGKLKIMGQGVNGWYSEVRSVKYQGKDLCFMIPPDLLKYITGEFDSCVVGSGRLMVDGDKFVYVTVIGGDTSPTRTRKNRYASSKQQD